MIRFSRILFLIPLIGIVSSCAPAQVDVQPTVAVEASAEPIRDLGLLPLDNPQVRADVELLIQSQASRTPEDIALIRKWHSRPVVAWNEQARYWVSYYGMDPVVASRVYALTSVAQQRALDAFEFVEVDFSTRLPGQLDPNIGPVATPGNPFESAVLIGATEPVFLYLFAQTENEIRAVFDEARKALLDSGNILPSDLEKAEAFGSAIAVELIAERKDDGSADAKKFDSLPSGEGIWHFDPFRARPEQPGWGRVAPWLMSTGDQFRAQPPPAFGSLAFQAAVEEVRLQQESISQGQLAIAQKWADKRFTPTPAGHWNLIAVDLILQYDLSDRDAARALSALNMAQMDAGIACWESKYHYMVVRPWQADPRISALVGYPNHPSYPSGHSCFSSASAETLSYFFPAERENLWQMASEASISRFYGGIHYLFDMEAGTEIGRQIGALAEEFAATQKWYPFVP